MSDQAILSGNGHFTHEDDVLLQCFLASAERGTEVALRQVVAGLVSFRIIQISDVMGRRLYTGETGFWGGNAWHRRSGRNCGAPTTPMRLVEPTEAIRVWAETHPVVSRDVKPRPVAARNNVFSQLRQAEPRRG